MPTRLVKLSLFNKTIHGTKTDAEKWLRGALARRDRGEPLEDPDITFEALFNEWLDSKKRKARTAEGADTGNLPGQFQVLHRKGIRLGAHLFDHVA